jgi:hypothetical protein
MAGVLHPAVMMATPIASAPTLEVHQLASGSEFIADTVPSTNYGTTAAGVVTGCVTRFIGAEGSDRSP